MLAVLLSQTFKNKNEAEKRGRGVIITLKAINIFVNISSNMKKSRTCSWIIIVKISKQKKHVKHYDEHTKAMQRQEKTNSQTWNNKKS